MIAHSSHPLRWPSILCILATLIACQTAPAPVAPAPRLSRPLYKDASQPVEKRVEDLLAWMTLDEKIGQMIQIEPPYIQPADVSKYLRPRFLIVWPSDRVGLSF